MRWAVTLVSLAALGLSTWLVFGALGYRDRPAVRLGATLGVSALALATEPVQQTLALGQVNLLLMLLVVADLLTGGALVPGGRTRWWHGFGIGIAAGVKLTPLIFIPYLLLIRKYRQAATATAVFAATVALGYAILPRDSRTYWADGLFLKANRIVFLGTRGHAVDRPGHPGRDRRAGHSRAAVPRRAAGARDAGLRADRPAGLPAELGS